jgi:hypothetical protein
MLVSPVKTTRFATVSLVLLLCVTASGFAQSNAAPDYKTQHKSAEKYQKDLEKQRRKQSKAEAKQAKAYRKQHQQ